MKNLVGAAIVALLITGVLAGASTPMHPKSILILGDGGGGPMPLCAPGDTTCDPGPGLPRPTAPRVR